MNFCINAQNSLLYLYQKLTILENIQNDDKQNENKTKKFHFELFALKQTIYVSAIEKIFFL